MYAHNKMITLPPSEEKKVKFCLKNSLVGHDVESIDALGWGRLGDTDPLSYHAELLSGETVCKHIDTIRKRFDIHLQMLTLPHLTCNFHNCGRNPRVEQSFTYTVSPTLKVLRGLEVS